MWTNSVEDDDENDDDDDGDYDDQDDDLAKSSCVLQHRLYQIINNFDRTLDASEDKMFEEHLAANRQ